MYSRCIRFANLSTLRTSRTLVTPISMVFALIASTIGLSGCVVSVDLENAAFRCTEPPFTCPDGRTCVGGFCVAPDAAPTIDADQGSPFFERVISILSAERITTGPLTVLVVLTPDRINYAAAGQDGSNLVFLDDADRELAFEVVEWQPDGATQLWLSVHSLDETSTIRMRYGQPISGGEGSASNVWPDHGLALHFENGVADSSAAAVPATATGGAITGAGYVGNAISLNGIDAAVDLGSDIAAFNGTTAATLSVWVNYNPTLGNRGVLEFSDEEAMVSRAVLSLTPDLEIRFGVLTEEGGTGENAVGEVLPENTWHWVLGTADLAGGRINVYVDGELQDSQPLLISNAEFPRTNSGAGAVGRNDTTESGFIEANLDEARAVSRPFSAADVKALHLSMTQELFVFGPESIKP